MIYDFSGFAQPNRRGLTGINDPDLEFSFCIGNAGGRSRRRPQRHAGASAGAGAGRSRRAPSPRGGSRRGNRRDSVRQQRAHRPRAHHASIESSGSTSGDRSTSGTDSGTDASPTDAATADDAASCDHRRDGAGRPPRVVRDAKGLSAFSAICTHACFTVALCGAGDTCSSPLLSPRDCADASRGPISSTGPAFPCPCHGSLFSTYGNVTQGPARIALPSVVSGLSSPRA